MFESAAFGIRPRGEERHRGVPWGSGGNGRDSGSWVAFAKYPTSKEARSK
jgi:hypothetical protein